MIRKELGKTDDPHEPGENETREELNLETVKATLAAFEWDLTIEEERMRSLDSKLMRIAGFSGIVISALSWLGTDGANAHSNGEPMSAQTFGLVLAIAAFVSAVMIAIRGLSPKGYESVSTDALKERLGRDRLSCAPEEIMREFAGSRYKALVTARRLNDEKANEALRGFSFAFVGLGFLVVVYLLELVCMK